MDWKDVAGTIGKAAPILGTILGGPAGGAIGGAISLISSALGLTKDETTPDRIAAILQADPNAMLELKKIEEQNRPELARIALEQDKMYLEDVQDARKRQTESEKATGKRDYNLYVLAWLVVSAFFLLVGLLMKWTLPEGNIGPVNQLFGAMSTGFGMVLQYFFGSSKGSADKTRLLINNGK